LVGRSRRGFDIVVCLGGNEKKWTKTATQPCMHPPPRLRKKKKRKKSQGGGALRGSLQTNNPIRF